MKKVPILAAITLILIVLLPAGAAIGCDEGPLDITFSQVDFLFLEAVVPDSTWGRIAASPSTLLDLLGCDTGYLNIWTDAGWVVQNLALRTACGSATIVTYFDLGLSQPKDVKKLSAYVDLTPDPVSYFWDGPRSYYPVGRSLWNAEGAGQRFVSAVGSPPPPGLTDFPYDGPNSVSGQPNENVQTAANQCFPMSIANSLQYLEEQYGVNIPNNHVPGINGDNSLVGQLDAASGRYAPSRDVGYGVWFTPMLEGKFAYLAANGLANAFTHRHQGRGYGIPPNEALPDGDFQSSGITSVDEGPVVTWEWICEQIENGEDVELVFSYEDPSGNITGGHAVRVFECGKTLGVPWVGYLHDSIQSNGDPTDSLGLEAVQVFTDDVDGDGTLNLGAPEREIRFAMSESPVPSAPVVPASPGIYISAGVCAGLAGLFLLFRRKRQASAA